MPTGLENEQKELAQFIRQGSSRGPQCFGSKRCPQGCGKRLPLASMLVHLNDDHRLTREQIAEWLTRESNG